MGRQDRKTIDCPRVELDGVRYVIVREAIFNELCRKSNVSASRRGASEAALVTEMNVDRASLAEKLIGRRKATGLTQAELARRAGIRPETLNRIERGKTTPDFATVRKLVVAMNAVELEATDL